MPSQLTNGARQTKGGTAVVFKVEKALFLNLVPSAHSCSGGGNDIESVKTEGKVEQCNCDVVGDSKRHIVEPLVVVTDVYKAVHARPEESNNKHGRMSVAPGLQRMPKGIELHSCHDLAQCQEWAYNCVKKEGMTDTVSEAVA